MIIRRRRIWRIPPTNFAKKNQKPENKTISDSTSEEKVNVVKDKIATIEDFEKNVKFDQIEKWLARAEGDFEKSAKPELEKYLQFVAKNPDEEIKLPEKYLKTVVSTYENAYNYGKLTASDENGEKAPKTDEIRTKRAAKFAEYIREKQTADIEAIIAAERLKLPVENSEKTASEMTAREVSPDILSELLTLAFLEFLTRAISGTRGYIANEAFNDGRNDAFSAAAQIGDLWMWSARMEKNTCATCGALHGTTYTAEMKENLGYVPGQMHMHCACIWITRHENSLFKLPPAGGKPANLDEIYKMQTSRKSDLQAAGIVGKNETKTDAIRAKFFNQINNGANIKEVENATRAKSVEYLSAWDKSGKKIAEISDNKESEVNLDDNFIKFIKSKKVSVITHNHPGSRSLSAADISIAADIDIDEVRASSRMFDYSLKKGEKGWPEIKMTQDDFIVYFEEKYVGAAYDDWEILAKNDKILRSFNEDERDRWIRSRATALFSEEFMLKYSQEKL